MQLMIKINSINSDQIQYHSASPTL